MRAMYSTIKVTIARDESTCHIRNSATPAKDPDVKRQVVCYGHTIGHGYRHRFLHYTRSAQRNQYTDLHSQWLMDRYNCTQI